MSTSPAIQAAAGIVAGIIGQTVTAYTSPDASDVVLIPDAAIWISPTVTLAYVQIDGILSRGYATDVVLETSIGTFPASDAGAAGSDRGGVDPYIKVAARILSTLQTLYVAA